MRQRHRGKNADKRLLLEGAGEDRAESAALALCRGWPMLFMNKKDEVSK